MAEIPTIAHVEARIGDLDVRLATADEIVTRCERRRVEMLTSAALAGTAVAKGEMEALLRERDRAAAEGEQCAIARASLVARLERLREAAAEAERRQAEEEREFILVALTGGRAAALHRFDLVLAELQAAAAALRKIDDSLVAATGSGYVATSFRQEQASLAEPAMEALANAGFVGVTLNTASARAGMSATDRAGGPDQRRHLDRILRTAAGLPVDDEPTPPDGDGGEPRPHPHSILAA